MPKVLVTHLFDKCIQACFGATFSVKIRNRCVYLHVFGDHVLQFRLKLWLLGQFSFCLLDCLLQRSPDQGLVARPGDPVIAWKSDYVYEKFKFRVIINKCWKLFGPNITR